VKILLRGFLCGLVYLAFSVLIVIVGCTQVLNAVGLSFVLGAVYGVAAALIVSCKKIAQTLLSCATGLVCVVFAFFAEGLYAKRIALYIYRYRNDFYVREMGRLSVQHRIGYGWGLNLVFKPCSLVVFIVAVFAVSVVSYIKKKSAKNKENKEETLL